MRNYLSFGGGVNSVAMMLLLLDEGVEFEAVYVWMPDWPETHEYLLMLEEKGYPIKIITGGARVGRKRIIEGNLYDYCWEYEMVADMHFRFCTRDFKIKVLQKYFQKPCFVMLGIDMGESHRARMSSVDGIENRYPLIERELSRSDCIKIIKAHDLPLPIKSGCFLCPFQRKTQIMQLRRLHPELFCRWVNLEKRNNEKRKRMGVAPRYIKKSGALTEIINERDAFLFEELDWPPCQCGL